MSDKPKVTGDWNSPSGIIRRPTDEPPKPETLPTKERRDHRDEMGATTGMMPIITEGIDNHAERDSDKHNGE
ncbi:MAG: hypothetical protein SH821_08525 [Phototrophicales bacterium]|nr:hypothetical protein [Phototrophicales bacterium]